MERSVQNIYKKKKNTLVENHDFITQPYETILRIKLRKTTHRSRTGVGKLFTRRARFGKTVDTAGRTLIGKQGEDLFFFFLGDHGPRTNVISKIKVFHLVFYSNFAPVKLIVLKITAIHDLQRKKKVFHLIHGGSLSLCKCRRARAKEPAGRIWPAGRSLPMSGLEPSTIDKAFKTKIY